MQNYSKAAAASVRPLPLRCCCSTCCSFEWRLKGRQQQLGAACHCHLCLVPLLLVASIIMPLIEFLAASLPLPRSPQKSNSSAAAIAKLFGSTKSCRSSSSSRSSELSCQGRQQQRHSNKAEASTEPDIDRQRGQAGKEGARVAYRMKLKRSNRIRK